MNPLQSSTGEFHTGASETEREAARLVTPKVPAQEQAVLDAICSSSGVTGWELCESLHMLRGSVSRSLTHLSDAELIESKSKRKEAKTKTQAQVWTATDKGFHLSHVPHPDEHPENRRQKAERLAAFIRGLHADLRIPFSASEWVKTWNQNIWDAIGRASHEASPPRTSIPVCVSLLEQQERVAS